MRIDIGGGAHPAQDHINLDPVHGEGDWRRRAQDGIPTPALSVERVRASHVMEHIPAGVERIAVFNDVHRVLVPGGTFEVIVPLLLPGFWQAIADPTHVSFWVRESFGYFDGSLAADASYGILPWATLSLEVVGGWEGHWIGTPR